MSAVLPTASKHSRNFSISAATTTSVRRPTRGIVPASTICGIAARTQAILTEQLRPDARRGRQGERGQLERPRPEAGQQPRDGAQRREPGQAGADQSLAMGPECPHQLGPANARAGATVLERGRGFPDIAVRLSRVRW